MASSRATTSAVSLEDWENLAPLNDKLKASVALITQASNEKPLPSRLVKTTRTLQGNASTRPGTPSIVAGGSSTNLLRRAASRVDLGNRRQSASAESSLPGTPRPRSPSRSGVFFSPPGTGTGQTSQLSHGHAQNTAGHGHGHAHGQSSHHTRTHSTTSALALQLHPNTTSSPSSYVNGRPVSNSDQVQHDPLEVHSPIETPQQFLDWFSGVEASMESDQEEVFRRYEMEIDAYITSCDEALEMMEDSRGLIKEMEANYRFVEDNSKALQLACEAMLEEQKHLMEITDAINYRLEYFRELETATRALSQPGDQVVLEEGFLNMLQRLDACLDFLKMKRNYRDADVYVIRFQQCLTRAMTLIKMHFLQLLSALHSDVASKLSGSGGGGGSGGGTGSKSGLGTGTNLSETALHALLYSKFSNLSENTRNLLFELEKRAIKNPDEYGSLLRECFGAWFNARNQLLGPTLAEEIRRMDPQNSDLVKLARAGCAYLRNVCTNEWTLFKDFFAYSGQDEIHHYLESLCDHLYDSLRPRILHEPKLDVLCELCNVLQALISLDGDADDEDDEEEGDIDDNEEGDTGSLVVRKKKNKHLQDNEMTVTEENSSFDITFANSTVNEDNFSVIQGHHRNSDLSPLPPPTRPSLRFSELLSTVLQDTQTRLVFRAQYIIEVEVFNFVPKPEDLDYPAKLKSKQNRKQHQDNNTNNSSATNALASENIDVDDNEIDNMDGKGKGREVLSLSQWQKENGGINSIGLVEEEGIVEFKLPPEEIMENWYPTLRKTLWILSKLHSYVNPAIFEDFAGEAVNLCRQSLTLASEKIASKGDSSKLDGQLFVIRHLLILKEMISNLDDFNSSDHNGGGNNGRTGGGGIIDNFFGIAEALSSILKNTPSLSLALLNPNNILNLAGRGMAGINEIIRNGVGIGGGQKTIGTMRDAKRDLDVSIKIICEDLMTQASLIIASPIRLFLIRCQAFLTLQEGQQNQGGDGNTISNNNTNSLSSQTWSTSEEILKLHDTFLAEGGEEIGSLEKGLREYLSKLQVFLDDEGDKSNAIGILIPPTINEILDHYTTFYNLVKSEYDSDVSFKMIPPVRVGERMRSIAGSSSSSSTSGWQKGREG